MVHIQLMKHMLDHADYAAPIRQHEVDHHHIGNVYALRDLHHEVRMDHTDHLPDACTFLL